MASQPPGGLTGLHGTAFSAAALRAWHTIAGAEPKIFRDELALSAKTGIGLASLRRRLLELAGWHAQPEGLFTARTRHVHALHRAGNHIARARERLALPTPALDLLAEELRLAHDALGEITGAFTNDDLLGEIFSHFCIGK